MKNPIRSSDDDVDFIGVDKKIIEEMKISAAVRDRRIYISDDINSNSMFKTMYLINRIIDVDKRSNSKEPIEIIVDSFGGFIYQGLALVGLIEKLKDEGYKIITTVQSIAMSMGFILLIVGSERRALRHARIMCHQPNSATWGTLQEQEESVEETNQLWIRLKNIIKKYTKITDSELEDIKSRKYDWFMWADVALEKGVIDYIE
jgi:ATP-dependent Clp protease protease subunit